MSPEEIILDRYEKSKLAPLYIIRGPINNESVDLEEWADDLSKKLIEKVKGPFEDFSQLGHSDLIFLHKDKEAKEFRLKDPAVTEFNKAHNYPPLELKHKFIFVFNAEAISTALANKWLKTLEEPLDSISTFFLCEKPTRLLQTIESRAITLRLKPKNSFKTLSPTSGDFHHYLGGKLTDKTSEKLSVYIRKGSLHHLLEFIKAGQEERRLIFDHLNEFIIAHPANIRIKSKWLEELKWFQKSKAYNNMVSERFVGLLQVIEQCS